MRLTLLTLSFLIFAPAFACQRPAAQRKAEDDRGIKHGVIPDVAQENMESYKRLLYVDQTLEELAAVSDPNAPPDDLDAALGHVRGGRPAEAKKSLRKVLDSPDSEIRQKIIAWRALAALGEKPPPAAAAEVHGVVLEVPVSDGTDTLAAYSDGRVRYVNSKQGAIIWEVTDDERIGPLVKNLIAAAGPLARKSRAVEKHLAPARGVFRVTALTFGGLRVAEGRSNDEVAGDRDLKAVEDAGTRLFLALLEENEKRREKL